MSVLAERDLQALVNAGMATPPRSDGTILLHKRRMNRSSDEENSDLPLLPVTVASDSCFSTIPDTLISQPTLLYLGFTLKKANSIWNKWRNWPYPREIDDDDDDDDPAGPMTFIEVILLQLEPADDCDTYYENDEEWYHFMDRCGINSELQTAIMDPRFTTIRLTNTCLYWLRDTIEIRYLGLQEIQAASHEREMALQRARTRPGGPQQSTTSGQRSISATLRERGGNSIHTSASEFSLRAARTQPGYTILFRGISSARLTRFRQSEEAFRTAELMSLPPTDFLWGTTGGYFALDRDVAIKYALFAKRRSQNGSALLLQFNVPNSAIESLPEGQLITVHWDPSGNDKTWEKLVYYSRNQGSAPNEFGRIALGTTLIIGTIAKKPNSSYGRMRSYEEITENYVFRNKEGRPAVQYVLHGLDVSGLEVRVADS
ncbi:hypothetical protein C2857_006355 [Epichloe festucae Fl1]|uniref:Uncharacterized protein n=1 Tax=Epichloe festucae (strain Fl1) TaxID=877507 RepID=A0A7S9KTE3_EPIFF|nr:hypothetical protein C2857_006355 [Epichloe festucae Fl1]